MPAACRVWTSHCCSGPLHLATHCYLRPLPDAPASPPPLIVSSPATRRALATQVVDSIGGADGNDAYPTAKADLAEVLVELSTVLSELELPDKAVPLLRRAMVLLAELQGERSEDVLACNDMLARALADSGACSSPLTG